MSTFSLSGADRRTLRGQGQLLEATVQVGREGLIATVVRELDEQLGRHRLIKVRFNTTDRVARQTLCEELAALTASALVGTVGRTALYYRPAVDNGPGAAAARGE